MAGRPAGDPVPPDRETTATSMSGSVWSLNPSVSIAGRDGRTLDEQVGVRGGVVRVRDP